MIPTSVGNLINLRKPFLDTNQLHGTVPDSNQLNVLAACEIESNKGLCQISDHANDICNFETLPKCKSDCLVLNEWLSMDTSMSCSDSRVLCNHDGRATHLLVEVGRLTS